MLSTRLYRSSALVLALAAGCGGVSSGTDGGTADGGPIVGNPCSINPKGPGCAYQVKAGAYHVYGVTNDAHAIVVDSNANVSMLDLENGSLTSVAAGFTNGFVRQDAAFVFHGGNNGSQHLPLAIWNAAGGLRELDPAGLMYSPLHYDGVHVAWVGNVSADGSTGDVRLGSADGKTATRTLLAGVGLNGSCGGWPELSLLGKRLLVTTCQPGAATHTLSSFDVDSGALVASLDQVELVFHTDSVNQRVLSRGATGAVVTDASLGNPTALATDYLDGVFTPDGTSVVYIDGEAKLLHVAAGGGTAALVQAGPVQFIQGISPDGKRALYSTSSDDTTGNADLYLTRLVDDAPAPFVLRQQIDAQILGDAFTADSQFALYAGAVDSAYNGAFEVQPVVGGPSREVTNLDFYWFALDGARVVYTDALVESTTPAGYSDGTADIELVDLSGAAIPTKLVKGANANMVLTADKKTLVFAIIDDAAKAGVYTMQLP
jgi:hypothetical protein